MPRFGVGVAAALLTVAALLIVFRHADNLRKIKAGTESRIV